MRRNKFGNKRVTIDGIPFHSIKESNRYKELKFLQSAGKISELMLQVPFVLFPKNENGGKLIYKADFVYIENGETIVEDVKGYPTKEYIIKKRLMAEFYNIKILET
jgi:hypothetical protein